MSGNAGKPRVARSCSRRVAGMVSPRDRWAGCHNTSKPQVPHLSKKVRLGNRILARPLGGSCPNMSTPLAPGQPSNEKARLRRGRLRKCLTESLKLGGSESRKRAGLRFAALRVKYAQSGWWVYQQRHTLASGSHHHWLSVSWRQRCPRGRSRAKEALLVSKVGAGGIAEAVTLAAYFG